MLLGVLKQKYTILQGVLPISIVANKDKQNASIEKLEFVVLLLTYVLLLYLKIKIFYMHNNNTKTEQVNNVQGSFSGTGGSFLTNNPRC